MQMKADEKSLRQLFTSNEVYTVPHYQRNYSWKSEQISAFLQDVELLTREGADEHFFGPLVVLQTEQGELSLIDGQQRLTTTMMLLSILRDHAENLTDKTYTMQGMTFHLPQMIIQLLKSNDLNRDRYVANYKIEKLFKDYVLRSPDDPYRKRFSLQAKTMTAEEKRATRELRSAYNAIDKEVRNWIGSVDPAEQSRRMYRVINAIQDRFSVLEIRMFNEDDAYVFFETLNERGLRLTPSDLLKNFTLRMASAADPESIQDVLDTWDSTVDQLGDFPFTKFLRHYLLAIQNDTVQAKTIFRTFTKIIEKMGENGAIENLNDLRRAAALYATILPGGKTGSDALDEVAQRLNSFSETHRVFLLAVLLGDFSVEVMIDAFRATEALAFRWILTGGNAQELETLYRTTANALVKFEDESLRTATAALLAALPKDDAISSTIVSSPAKSELQTYVMRRLVDSQAADPQTWQATTLVLDFLAPQRPKPGSEWFSKVAPAQPSNPNEPTYDDFTSKWGNLTLLENALDGKVQNADWREKVNGDKSGMAAGLANSKVPITQDVSKLTDWTADSIDKRTQWVADSMVEITSAVNALNSTTAIRAFSLM